MGKQIHDLDCDLDDDCTCGLGEHMDEMASIYDSMEASLCTTAEVRAMDYEELIGELEYMIDAVEQAKKVKLGLNPFDTSEKAIDDSLSEIIGQFEQRVEQAQLRLRILKLLPGG